MIVYNHSKDPIFISVGVIEAPNGGHGNARETYSILYGQGIDLDIVGLKQAAPSKDVKGTKDCHKDKAAGGKSNARRIK